MPSRTDCLEAGPAAGATLLVGCASSGTSRASEDPAIRPVTRHSGTGSSWVVFPADVTAAATLQAGLPAGTLVDRSDSMLRAGVSSDPQQPGAPT